MNHFVLPAAYLSIMPRFLPWPAQLVAISGVAEILGGVGILFSPTRRIAGIWLILLLLAVFPANIEALRSGMSIGGHAVPVWALWARLPLQVVLIVWVFRCCLSRDSVVIPSEAQRSRGIP